MDKNSMVSVILPVKNAKSTILMAIDSILSQKHIDLELLVINDNSTDSTPSTLSNINDNRLVVLENNGFGIVDALNTGIAHSKGQYIARMDADDISLPNRLYWQKSYLDNHPNIGVISGMVKYKGDKNKNEGYYRHVLWLNELNTPQQLYLNRFVDSPVAHPSVMVRRSCFDTFGTYAQGDFPEDFELWLRFMNHRVQFSKLGSYVLEWGDSTKRLSRTDPRYSKEAFFDIKAKYFALWYKTTSQKPIYVWGKGAHVNRKVKFLSKYGLKIEGFIDIKPTSNKYLFYKNITNEMFILSYVGDRIGRTKIREYLTQHGFIEGTNFYMMA